ncbi:MAG: hypothetical protein ACAH88_00350 [Roseimicrobium sp.]
MTIMPLTSCRWVFITSRTAAGALSIGFPKPGIRTWSIAMATKSGREDK